MNLKEAYNYGVYFLSANGIEEAEFKSLCLVCHLDSIKNSQFKLHFDDEIIMKRFADLLWRVKSGEPLQYVIGKWDFFESEFFVGKGVLIPRPETEELVELAVCKAKQYKNPVIIDLCSGSGCIGISIAKKIPSSKVYCIEKSTDAMFYLSKNAQGTENVNLVNADINDDVGIEKADIIISNPPYIKSDEIDSLQSEVKYEPRMALDGGTDGLDFYRIINNKWYNKLKENGILLLEIGSDQGKTINSVLTDFNNVEVKKDIYGNDRMVIAQK